MRPTYLSAAAALSAAGLKAGSRVLSRVTQENSTAVLIFAAATWMSAVGVDKKPDELPPFGVVRSSVPGGTDGSGGVSADWLVLLRGIVSIVMNGWTWLNNGDLGPVLTLYYWHTNGNPGVADEKLVALKTLIEGSVSDEAKLTL